MEAKLLTVWLFGMVVAMFVALRKLERDLKENKISEIEILKPVLGDMTVPVIVAVLAVVLVVFWPYSLLSHAVKAIVRLVGKK